MIEAPPVTSVVEKCLQSLCFGEINLKREKIHKQTEETCTWILNHRLYLQWVDSSSGALWIRGAPGVSKSIVMKYAVSQLEGDNKTFKEDGECPQLMALVHFFRWDGARLERLLEGLCRSLLHQLLSHFPDRLTALRDTYRMKSEGFDFQNEKIQWGTLFQLLEDSILDVVQVANLPVFIDGLDECDEDDAKLAIGMLQRVAENHEKREMYSEKRQLLVCYGCRNNSLIVYDSDPSIDVQQKNREHTEICINCFI